MTYSGDIIIQAQQIKAYHEAQQALSTNAFLDSYYLFRVMLFQRYHIARVDVLHSCARHRCHEIDGRIELWEDPDNGTTFYYCAYSGRHHCCQPRTHACPFTFAAHTGQNQGRSSHCCVYSGVEVSIDTAPEKFNHESDLSREFLAGKPTPVYLPESNPLLSNTPTPAPLSPPPPPPALTQSVASQVRQEILALPLERENIFCHIVGNDPIDAKVQFWSECVDVIHLALHEISPHWLVSSNMRTDKILHYITFNESRYKQPLPYDYAATFMHFPSSFKTIPDTPEYILPADTYWNDIALRDFLRTKRDLIARRLHIVVAKPTPPPTKHAVTVYIPTANNKLSLQSCSISPVLHEHVYDLALALEQMAIWLMYDVTEGPFAYNSFSQVTRDAVSRVLMWSKCMAARVFEPDDLRFIEISACHFVAIALSAGSWSTRDGYRLLFNKKSSTQFFRKCVKEHGFIYTLLLAGIEYCLFHLYGTRCKVIRRLECVARHWVIPMLQTTSVNIFDAAV